jgi:hypothetical protein
MASIYSEDKQQELFNKVLSYMFEGQTLTKSIELVGITPPTFYVWLKNPKHPERFKEYACAREALADLLFDKMFDIANDDEDDEKPIVGTNHIQRDKLRIDTYKWALGKLSSKFADSVKLQGDAENPIEQKVVVEIKKARDLKNEESED